jgi:hypothetical protein
MTVGFEMTFAIARKYSQNQRSAIDSLSIRELDSLDKAESV